MQQWHLCSRRKWTQILQQTALVQRVTPWYVCLSVVFLSWLWVGMGKINLQMFIFKDGKCFFADVDGFDWNLEPKILDKVGNNRRYIQIKYFVSSSISKYQSIVESKEQSQACNAACTSTLLAILSSSLWLCKQFPRWLENLLLGKVLFKTLHIFL